MDAEGDVGEGPGIPVPAGRCPGDKGDSHQRWMGHGRAQLDGYLGSRLGFAQPHTRARCIFTFQSCCILGVRSGERGGRLWGANVWVPADQHVPGCPLHRREPVLRPAALPGRCHAVGLRRAGSRERADWLLQVPCVLGHPIFLHRAGATKASPPQESPAPTSPNPIPFNPSLCKLAGKTHGAPQPGTQPGALCRAIAPLGRQW